MSMNSIKNVCNSFVLFGMPLLIQHFITYNILFNNLFFHRKLGIDLVPRIGPLEVNPHKIGIVALHGVHVISAENANASSSVSLFYSSLKKNIVT